MFGSTESIKEIIKMEKLPGTLRTVEGDATEPQTTAPKEIVLIPHCCNNGTDEKGIGVMGAGVALALRKKWPLVYGVYKEMESKSISGLRDRLGENCYVKIDNHLVVVNMIAQNMIMSENNPKPLKYEALIKCMIGIVKYIEMVQTKTANPIVIHTPEFGGLRAGGNFEFVLELIKEIWIENGIDVVIYQFKE